MAKYDLTNTIPFNEQSLYKQGYEDAIEKACEWIRGLYPPINGHDYTHVAEKMVEKFRKAMED